MTAEKELKAKEEHREEEISNLRFLLSNGQDEVLKIVKDCRAKEEAILAVSISVLICSLVLLYFLFLKLREDIDIYNTPSFNRALPVSDGNVKKKTKHYQY